MLTAAILTTATPAQAEKPVAPNCDRFATTAREVGWRKRDLPELLRICTRESKGFERALNKLDPYQSFGILQINGSWKGYLMRQGYIKRSMNELWRPRLSLKVGLHIHGLYGWRPWATRSTK